MRSWVRHFPQGSREQPGWVFISIMCFLAGISFALGISESTSITRELDPFWLKVWGGFLTLAGALLLVATLMMRLALEKFALRMLSIVILVYIGWILVTVPLSRASFATFLSLSLVVLAEIRVAVIKDKLKASSP